MDQENQNQEQQFRCTGDCINCNRAQREYCGAQKGYDNHQLLLEMQKSLVAMSGTVDELKHKIAAIQDSESMVFDPNEDVDVATQQHTDQSQEGDGV